jgi:hypothetical protein
MRVRDIVGGNFALLNSDMNDLVQAGAIPGGVDVADIGLHEVIGHDAAVFELHADLIQAKRGHIRHPPEAIKDFIRSRLQGLAFAFKRNFFMAADTLGAEEFGSGI